MPNDATTTVTLEDVEAACAAVGWTLDLYGGEVRYQYDSAHVAKWAGSDADAIRLLRARGDYTIQRIGDRYYVYIESQIEKSAEADTLADAAVRAILEARE